MTHQVVPFNHTADVCVIRGGGRLALLNLWLSKLFTSCLLAQFNRDGIHSPSGSYSHSEYLCCKRGGGGSAEQGVFKIAVQVLFSPI